MFSTTPFALQNSAHSADLFRQAVSSLIPPGGGLVTTGDLAVTQTGTPSMNVSVGVGRCWIPGTNVGNVTGGNFSSQAMYYGQNPAAYTASVTTADSVNPRIDVVYAAVQDSQYAGTTNAGVIAVAAGAPASGAAYPANAPTLPANSIALAWINVAANASSITNANITNLAAAYYTGVETYTFDAAYTGGWTTNARISRTRLAGGAYRYIMDYTASRNLTGFNINGSMTSLFSPTPTAWRPTTALPVSAYGALRDNFGNYIGPLNIQLNLDGSVNVSTLTGNTLTLPQFGSISFSVTWSA